VNSPEDIEAAIALSPHALCFGDNLSSNIQETVDDIIDVCDTLPSHYKIVLMQTVHTLDEAEIALKAPLDALIVSQDLLTRERKAKELHKMIAAARQ
jgi:hypothetical protein